MPKSTKKVAVELTQAENVRLAELRNKDAANLTEADEKELKELEVKLA